VVPELPLFTDAVDTLRFILGAVFEAEPPPIPLD
jgi:hypothetical protein